MNRLPGAAPHHGAHVRPSVALLLCLLVGLGALPAAAGDLGGAEPVAAGDPAGVDPGFDSRLLPTGSEALIGTIGFRSASAAFLGQYVTTGITVNDSGVMTARDRKLKARATANPLTFELGLFRDGGGRFRLLAENGQWVALKPTTALPDGVFQAAAGRWSAAWGFKAVRPDPAGLPVEVLGELTGSDVDPGLPVCLEAYKGTTYKGLLTLNDSGWLVLDPAGTCGATTRSLFMTDDLPTGTATKALLAAPKTPPDEITRVRFVAPDRPALSLTASERRDAVTEINLYFNSLADLNDRVFTKAKSDLLYINTYLSVSSITIPGEEAEATDWWKITEDVLVTGTKLIPGYGTAISIGIKVASTVARIGVTYYENQNLEGPRVIDDVTNAQVATVAELAAKLDLENSRTGTNLQALKVMLKEGCPTPAIVASCVSDRRLAQWLADPAVFPDQTQLWEDQQATIYQKTFYQRLLPVRGRLVQYWLNVPNEHYDRPFTLEESLGDGQNGFGTEVSGAPWSGAIMFSSVWMPWDNHIEHWEGVFSGWDTHHRPIAAAWVIGLSNTGDTAAPTVLVGPTYQHITDRLFEPYNPAAPLEGGFGLSYKEVACEWLVGQTGYGYWYEGHWYHPCHFSFYDPGDTDGTPTLVNNTARWANFTEANSEATYNANGNAIAWFPPDRTEQVAGRPASDPDIFSWQIPHLAYRACSTPLPRSTATGAAASVYFANLTTGPVSIRRVNSDGTRTLVATLPVWAGLAHPAAGSGAIPYSAATPAMFRADSYVGVVYVAQTEAGECIGTYAVTDPPADAVLYQVAEIHGHSEGAGNILNH